MLPQSYERKKDAGAVSAGFLTFSGTKAADGSRKAQPGSAGQAFRAWLLSG
jgi:hypothetical protein